MLIHLLFLLLLLSLPLGVSGDGLSLPLSLVGGIACPYSAAWLSSTELFMKASISLSEPKMEEASFAIFRKAERLYQPSHHKYFNVIHMSAYEHGVDKFEGLDIAEQKTKILSETAQNEECSSLPQHPSLDSDMTASYAFVPFYSKKPPGLKVNPVTKRIKVTSIGQGNSLVSADVKVAQLGATVCSILRHVERAIVGVTDRKEEALVESMILQQMPTVSDRIAIQVFQVDIPALLPFYLLKWAQYIILKQNCIVVASTSRQSGYCSTHQSLIDMTWKMPFPHDHKPVSTVYYSEADTILHPINASVLRLVSEASDEFTLISPVRVEKRSSSAPESYKAMETLVLARNPCGRPVCRLSENRTGPVAIQCNTSISHKQRPGSSRLGKGFQAKTLRFRGDPRLRRWRSKKKPSDLPQLLQHKLEVQQAVLKVSKQ